MQYFKGDDFEKKAYAAVAPIFDAVGLQKDLYFAGAYGSGTLGDLLYITMRAPLTHAMKQEVFRLTFKEIFQAFVYGGVLEAYITVFKKIFGETVTIVFGVPGPGKLTIDIAADGVEISNLLSRYIEDNTYLFDELITQGGDNIAVQTVKGFQTQYELEQMLFEMVPGGIYTVISLTVGA